MSSTPDVQEDKEQWDYMKSERDDDYDEKYNEIKKKYNGWYEGMLLQLNWGKYFKDGRDELTCDDDWKLLSEAINEGYNETMFQRVKARLNERDGYDTE